MTRAEAIMETRDPRLFIADDCYQQMARSYVQELSGYAPTEKADAVMIRFASFVIPMAGGCL